MKANIDLEIEELLSRNVAELIDPDGFFRNKLKENPGKVVVKLGVDPTRPDIHIGHAVVLRKLRKFQDLGCKVVFLVGDFTALIGDPSGRNKARPEVSKDEVEANMKTYLEQVNKILKTDKEVFSWIKNSDWFLNVTDLIFSPDHKAELTLRKDGKEMTVPLDPNSFVGKAFAFEQSRMQVSELGMKSKVAVVTLKSFLSTLRRITHSRLIERDMFQERIKSGNELYMHEMMYPVLQGIDSSVMATIYGSCDLEVGGTDQTFNMLMGRDVMKQNGQDPQAVISFELLAGTDGKEKMSKSLDNYVGITEAPDVMFGKIMSIPDSLIVSYFEMCTYTPLDDIAKIRRDLENGKINPKDIKQRLAREIVAIYHGVAVSENAEKNFVNVFSKGAMPENISEHKVKSGVKLVDCLLEVNLTSSKTEARRLISEGAVENVDTQEKIEDPEFILTKTIIIRVGKKRFAKLII
jgi:tyrosyl-tRNA synthetase